MRRRHGSLRAPLAGPTANPPLESGGKSKLTRPHLPIARDAAAEAYGTMCRREALLGIISDTHGPLRAEAIGALGGSDIIIHARRRYEKGREKSNCRGQAIEAKHNDAPTNKKSARMGLCIPRAVGIIIELEQGFGGLVHISPQPMRQAVEELEAQLHE